MSDDIPGVDEPEAGDDPAPSEDEAPPNAADPKQYARAVRGRRQQQREERDFELGLLGSQVGRRWVWGLLTDCRTFDDIFAFGPNGFPDPHQTSFCQGQKAIGQRLWRKLLGSAPELVEQMHREHDPALMGSESRRRKANAIG